MRVPIKGGHQRPYICGVLEARHADVRLLNSVIMSYVQVTSHAVAHTSATWTFVPEYNDNIK